MERETDHEAALGRWLAAEHRSDDATAEDEAAKVVGRLPSLRPRPDFAARVVSTALDEGVARGPAGRRRWGAGRWLVWGIAGLSTAVVTLTLLGPFLVRQVARLLNFSVQGFVWIVGGLEGGLDTWSLVTEVGRAIGASLSLPQVSGAIVGVELVGVAALYALHRVLADDREPEA